MPRSLFLSLVIMMCTAAARAQEAAPVVAEAAPPTLPPVPVAKAPALAEPPKSACEQSFPERYKATLKLLGEWYRERKAYEKFEKSPKGKALAFFYENCRFLNGFERAVRKLDAPAVIVCDPAAGPKPKLLTPKLFWDPAIEEPTIHGTDRANLDCQDEDPVDLVVSSDDGDKLNSAKQQLVLCYQQTDKLCVEIVGLIQDKYGAQFARRRR